MKKKSPPRAPQYPPNQQSPFPAMSPAETRTSGSQREQCQANTVGEAKDLSQAHAAPFGQSKTQAARHHLAETQPQAPIPQVPRQTRQLSTAHIRTNGLALWKNLIVLIL